MDSVSNRLQAGFSWLTSGLSNSTLFDTLSIPFTDSSFSTSAIRPTQSSITSSGSDHIIYVDHSGHQMSEAEVEALDRAAFSDSPWGFVASRYALTLGVMAVVVNRITHICRPQGRPRPLSNPRRLAIQLPTLLFLIWSGFLLLLVTLHSFAKSSSIPNRIIGSSWLPSDVHVLVNTSASETDVHSANSALLWRLFLSVCLAVVSSTLLRTLEGHNTIVNPDDLGNSPTFNLVGFAVLLHLHASSYTFPPNKHVYLSILFQVGEVLGLQACTCWTTPPISRLTLTSIFGLTSTLHYLHAIRSGDRGYPFLQSFSRAPDLGLIAIILLTLTLHTFTALITSTPLSFSRLVDPRSLPLPSDDYSLALFKLGTACLSSTKLSGLDSDLIDVNISKESWIEVDEGQVRVRNPNGKLTQTNGQSRIGFNNEIRRIKSSKQSRNGRHPFRSAAWQGRFKFFLVLMRTVRGLAYWFGARIVDILPFTLPQIRVPQWTYRLIRLIRLAWHGTNGEERRRLRIEERRRIAERTARMNADQALRDRMEGAGRAIGVSTSTSAHLSTPNQIRHRNRALSPDLANISPNSWHHYFAQDFSEESEGEDEEWKEEIEEEEMTAFSRTGSPSPISTETDYWQRLGSGSRLNVDDEQIEDLEDDDEDGWEDDVNPADMSAELLMLARREFSDDEGIKEMEEKDESYARILMAHMSTPNSKVLTRRGYRDLVGRFADKGDQEDVQILADVIRQRRIGVPGNESNSASSSSSSNAERERMRLCVICYAEDRTIICWPCKCLALCDGCREAMAARPPPRNHHRQHTGTPGGGGLLGNEGYGMEGGLATATHTCPTCRTPVIGFSRIFLP